MKPVLPHICIALKKYYHNVDEKTKKNKFTLGEQSLVQTCRCFLTYCKTAKRSAYVYKNNENMQWILKVCWKTSALNTQGVFVKVFFFQLRQHYHQTSTSSIAGFPSEGATAVWGCMTTQIRPSRFYYSWHCIIKHLHDLALSVTIHAVYKAYSSQVFSYITKKNQMFGTRRSRRWNKKNIFKKNNLRKDYPNRPGKK